MSKYCRERIDAEAHKQTPVTSPQAETKPVVCFSCHEVGHKSPQCPKKQKRTVKRIEIPTDSVKALRSNKVMAEISGTMIPLTIDLGTQMTVVPLEVVQPQRNNHL